MTPREIRIQSVANGYIVSVGCQTFVFNDDALMLNELRRYLANPEKVEKDYFQAYPRLANLGALNPPLVPTELDGPNINGYAGARVAMPAAGTLEGGAAQGRQLR